MYFYYSQALFHISSSTEHQKGSYSVSATLFKYRLDFIGIMWHIHHLLTVATDVSGASLGGGGCGKATR